jgi:hypothetical protein
MSVRCVVAKTHTDEKRVGQSHCFCDSGSLYVGIALETSVRYGTRGVYHTPVQLHGPCEMNVVGKPADGVYIFPGGHNGLCTVQRDKLGSCGRILQFIQPNRVIAFLYKPSSGVTATTGCLGGSAQLHTWAAKTLVEVLPCAYSEGDITSQTRDPAVLQRRQHLESGRTDSLHSAFVDTEMGRTEAGLVGSIAQRRAAYTVDGDEKAYLFYPRGELGAHMYPYATDKEYAWARAVPQSAPEQAVREAHAALDSHS